MSAENTVCRPLSPQELVAYDALARDVGNVFFTREWFDAARVPVTPLGIFDRAGNLVGGAAVWMRRVAGATVIRPLPYAPCTGPFVRLRAASAVGQLEEYRHAVRAFADFVRAARPAACAIPLVPGLPDALPFFWNGFKVIPRYTYRIDLSRSVEQLHAGMTAARRNDIRKAERDGLTAQVGAPTADLRRLVESTYARQGEGADWASIDRILQAFARPGNAYTCMAYDGDHPLAGCLVVHDARTAFLLLAGYDHKRAHHGAGPLSLWAAIRYAHSLGLSIFDFEGSVIPPIERYYRQFGGTLTPVLSANRAWFPLEVVLKARRRNVF